MHKLGSALVGIEAKLVLVLLLKLHAGKHIEDGVDGRQIEVLVAAEIYGSHILCRHPYAASYHQEKQAANGQGAHRGKYTATCASHSLQLTGRDAPQEPRHQGCKHHDIEHAQQYVSYRHTGCRVLGRVEIDKHGGVELALPEGKERRVGNEDERHKQHHYYIIRCKHLAQRHLTPPHRCQHEQERNGGEIAGCCRIEPCSIPGYA